MQTYFDQLDRVRYEGPKSTNPLVSVITTRMNWCWANGWKIIAFCGLLLAHLLLEWRRYGVGSFDRPRQQPATPEMAKRKADVAFEFFHKLNVPYYCFHDVDVSGRRFAQELAITSPGWSRCWLRNSSRAA